MGNELRTDKWSADYEGDDPEILNRDDVAYPIIEHDPRGVRKGWVVRQWKDEDGDTIQEFESGIIRNHTTGKIIRTSDYHHLTKENAREMGKALQEMYKNRLREEFSARVSKAIYGKEIHNIPVDAVAICGGDLWEEIVMNKNAYPRDRLNAYLALGKQAGILQDENYKEESNGMTITLGVELARELVERMKNRNNT